MTALSKSNKKTLKILFCEEKSCESHFFIFAFNLVIQAQMFGCACSKRK